MVHSPDVSFKCRTYLNNNNCRRPEQLVFTYVYLTKTYFENIIKLLAWLIKIYRTFEDML